jgi:hypothetical protein
MSKAVPKVGQFQNRNSSEKVAKQSQKRDTDTVRTRSLQKATPSSGRARKAKPKIPLPEGWEPKPLTLGTMCAQIVSAWQPGRIERELSKFRDHHLRSDQRWSDWDAAWRTWIQRAGEFERGGNGYGNEQFGTDSLTAIALQRFNVGPGSWSWRSASSLSCRRA